MAETNFSYSETFGPFPCEHDGCEERRCWQIKVTEDELEGLKKEFPDQDGHPMADRYKMSVAVLTRKMGVAFCDNHHSL